MLRRLKSKDWKKKSFNKNVKSSVSKLKRLNYIGLSRKRLLLRKPKRPELRKKEQLQSKLSKKDLRMSECKLKKRNSDQSMKELKKKSLKEQKNNAFKKKPIVSKLINRHNYFKNNRKLSVQKLRDRKMKELKQSVLRLNLKNKDQSKKDSNKNVQWLNKLSKLE